jgi:uncharacterized protein (TIGR02598 family)
MRKMPPGSKHALDWNLFRYPNPGKGAPGFSLLELLFAIGVFVFCVLSIVGLLGVALNGSMDSQRDSALISIVRTLDSELREETLKGLHSSGVVQDDYTHYFDLVGKPVEATASTKIYEVKVHRIAAADVASVSPELKDVALAAKPLYLWSVEVLLSASSHGQRLLLGHSLYE